MSSSFEREKNGKLSFLDIEVSREKGKFVTTVYRKPTFSGVYTQFIPYYGETDRHLKVRSAEHIGISSLIFKKKFAYQTSRPILNKIISSAKLFLFDNS